MLTADWKAPADLGETARQLLRGEISVAGRRGADTNHGDISFGQSPFRDPSPPSEGPRHGFADHVLQAGSKKGALAAWILVIFPASMSTPWTRWPNLARQAAVTHPNVTQAQHNNGALISPHDDTHLEWNAVSMVGLLTSMPSGAHRSARDRIPRNVATLIIVK